MLSHFYFWLASQGGRVHCVMSLGSWEQKECITLCMKTSSSTLRTSSNFKQHLADELKLLLLAYELKLQAAPCLQTQNAAAGNFKQHLADELKLLLLVWRT